MRFIWLIMLCNSLIIAEVRKEYFPTGELKTVSQYSKGLKEGKEIVYTKDGRISFIQHYIQGVANGAWQFFHPNGGGMKATMINGKAEGLYYFINKNNQIFRIQTLKHGTLHGLSKELDEANRTLLEITYHKGKPIEFRLFSDDFSWQYVLDLFNYIPIAFYLIDDKGKIVAYDRKILEHYFTKRMQEFAGLLYY